MAAAANASSATEFRGVMRRLCTGSGRMSTVGLAGARSTTGLAGVRSTTGLGGSSGGVSGGARATPLRRSVRPFGIDMIGARSKSWTGCWWRAALSVLGQSKHAMLESRRWLESGEQRQRGQPGAGCRVPGAGLASVIEARQTAVDRPGLARIVFYIRMAIDMMKSSILRTVNSFQSSNQSNVGL